jgi:hypothetical protein
VFFLSEIIYFQFSVQKGRFLIVNFDFSYCRAKYFQSVFSDFGLNRSIFEHLGAILKQVIFALIAICGLIWEIF